MDKALSFFRIFDLAMFLPGLAMYRALQGDPLLAALHPVPESAGISSVPDLMHLVATIALVYVLGLAVHAVQRILFKWLGLGAGLQTVLERLALQHESPKKWSLPDPLRAELAGYFWYMRATCLNLAVVAVAALLIWFGRLSGAEGVALGGLAVLMTFLGTEFDRALRGDDTHRRPG